MIKIEGLGVTYEDKEGNVGMALLADMPKDCIAVFIKKEEYDELLSLLKEHNK